MFITFEIERECNFNIKDGSDDFLNVPFIAPNYGINACGKKSINSMHIQGGGCNLVKVMARA